MTPKHTNAPQARGDSQESETMIKRDNHSTRHFRRTEIEVAIRRLIARLENPTNGMELDALLIGIQWLARERDKCLPQRLAS